MPPSAVPMRWPSAPGCRPTPAREYEALVGFCLAKPGVAAALQTESWEQLVAAIQRRPSPVAAPLPGCPAARGGHSRRRLKPSGTDGPGCRLDPGVHTAPRPRFPAAMATIPPGPWWHPCVRFRAAPQPTFSRNPAGHPRPARQTHPDPVRQLSCNRPCSGLRYEGSRLLRRGILLVTLGITLWQSNIISPGPDCASAGGGCRAPGHQTRPIPWRCVWTTA